jgi:hypothetical protein
MVGSKQIMSDKILVTAAINPLSIKCGNVTDDPLCPIFLPPSFPASADIIESEDQSAMSYEL